MAFIARVIFFILCTIHGSAFAVQVKVSPVYYYAAGSYGHAGLTPQAACTSYANALSYTFISVVGNTCNYSASNGTFFPTASVFPGCPGGVGSIIGDGCYVSASQCPEGTEEDSAGFCQDLPPECQPNQELDTETNTCVCKTGDAGSFAVSGDVLYGCNDGCSMVLNSGSYSSSANKTYGYWRQNGNTCTPAPDTPAPESPSSPDGQDAGKCPIGQCPGTINGTSVCVPCKAKEVTDTSSSENTTETPAGASAPSGSSSTSSSGSKSTECEGGVCTTKEVVTVTNPDGSTTDKQKETTESISDYCAKNPNAAICKAEEAGQWGGACAGGFQCSGDAVQCAQAQASWKAACLFDVGADDPNVVKGGQAMSSDQSALRAQLGLDDTGDNFNLSSMIDSDPLFASGGGCPSDQQVTLLGQSLTLSLSSWCSWLQTAGTILQAAAYLAAALIVFRRG